MFNYSRLTAVIPNDNTVHRSKCSYSSVLYHFKVVNKLGHSFLSTKVKTSTKLR